MSQTTVNNNPRLRRSGVNRIIQILVLLILQGIVLFAAAGQVAWLRAWFFIGLYIVFLMISAVTLFRTNPELINQRGELKRDTRKFDKIIGIFYTSLVFVVPAVAGLDFRFSWSAMSLLWTGFGSVLWISGYLLLLWAMVENTHFETMVRIQKERDHHVVTSGPYQYVRHPGYVGMILMWVGTPLILGSWWAFLPAGLIFVLFFIRTTLEDRILRSELPGYTEYANRVHYRLLPGVW